MRDANLQRFLSVEDPTVEERPVAYADGSTARSCRGKRGRRGVAVRSSRWGSVLAAVVRRDRCALSPVAEVLAMRVPLARRCSRADRINRFVQQPLPRRQADCLGRVALALTVEV